jgi:hypothetical protein
VIYAVPKEISMALNRHDHSEPFTVRAGSFQIYGRAARAFSHAPFRSSPTLHTIALRSIR